MVRYKVSYKTGIVDKPVERTAGGWNITIRDQDGDGVYTWIPEGAKFTVETPLPNGSVVVGGVGIINVKHNGGWSYTAPSGGFITHDDGVERHQYTDEEILRGGARVVHYGTYREGSGVNLNQTPHIIDAEFEIDVESEYDSDRDYYGLKSLTTLNANGNYTEIYLPGDARLEKVEDDELPLGTVVGIFDGGFDRNELSALYVKNGGRAYGPWDFTVLGGVFIGRVLARQADAEILSQDGARIVYRPDTDET